jgi:hypothetical protein
LLHGAEQLPMEGWRGEKGQGWLTFKPQLTQRLNTPFSQILKPLSMEAPGATPWGNFQLWVIPKING